MRWIGLRGPAGALGLTLLLAAPVTVLGAWRDDARSVSRQEIAAAMAHSTGYALSATANGPRLQAEVVLRLVREALAGDATRRPLRLGHQEWFDAFLDRTGLRTDQAPLYVRLPHEMGQDLWIDYRRERVLESVAVGPEPKIAANVWIAWNDTPGRGRSYSYDDELSSPRLRVTQEQVIHYRLLDYGDRLWYAEISGLYGRPTSGPLGLLFNIIGEARVRESRCAFARDETQVVRGRATKWGIDKTETVTVWADGHADRGVPEGREDLRRLAARLEETLEVRFRPLDEE
jgi:hypothetical protein